MQGTYFISECLRENSREFVVTNSSELAMPLPFVFGSFFWHRNYRDEGD